MADDENIIVNDEEPIVLSQFPPLFNDTEVPFFPEIDCEPKNIQNEHQSEGGRRIIQSIRKDRLSASVKLKVANDEWVRFFYDLYKNEDSVTFSQYNPLIQDYDERTVSIENFKYKMVKDSQKLEAVVGVWEMSFSIEEF